MFNRFCFNSIRRIEASIFGGPETVEHNFERDGNFRVEREFSRGNGDAGISNTPESKSDIWYYSIFDPKNQEIRYEFPNDES